MCEACERIGKNASVAADCLLERLSHIMNEMSMAGVALDFPQWKEFLVLFGLLDELCMEHLVPTISSEDEAWAEGKGKEDYCGLIDWEEHNE